MESHTPVLRPVRQKIDPIASKGPVFRRHIRVHGVRILINRDINGLRRNGKCHRLCGYGLADCPARRRQVDRVGAAGNRHHIKLDSATRNWLRGPLALDLPRINDIDRLSETGDNRRQRNRITQENRLLVHDNRA